MFQTLHYVEEENETGRVVSAFREMEIGRYSTEQAAVAAARASMATFVHAERPEYAWWIVRREGEQMATWFADSRTRREFTVDLMTRRLVEVA